MGLESICPVKLFPLLLLQASVQTAFTWVVLLSLLVPFSISPAVLIYLICSLLGVVCVQMSVRVKLLSHLLKMHIFEPADRKQFPS